MLKHGACFYSQLFYDFTVPPVCINNPDVLTHTFTLLFTYKHNPSKFGTSKFKQIAIKYICYSAIYSLIIQSFNDSAENRERT